MEILTAKDALQQLDKMNVTYLTDEGWYSIGNSTELEEQTPELKEIFEVLRNTYAPNEFINQLESENNSMVWLIDFEKSNLAKGIIKFKKKDITYDDILQAYTIRYGSIVVSSSNIDKLLAISKLMDIAKYYNGDWKPNWRSLTESKYYIYYSTRSNIYGVSNTSSTKYINIYFRLYKNAKAVIDNPNFRDILDAIYKN